MAVKAEQVHSRPGAITWIFVSERACSVTSRALDVTRDKVLVTCFYVGREDKYWYVEQDAQSHTRCACPHTLFLADKTLTALVQWCGTARMQPLARWHRCCERSQGEHLPHQADADAQQQQSGRCLRHCVRRCVAGHISSNGRK